MHSPKKTSCLSIGILLGVVVVYLAYFLSSASHWRGMTHTYRNVISWIKDAGADGKEIYVYGFPDYEEYIPAFGVEGDNLLAAIKPPFNPGLSNVKIKFSPWDDILASPSKDVAIIYWNHALLKASRVGNKLLKKYLQILPLSKVERPGAVNVSESSGVNFVSPVKATLLGSLPLKVKSLVYDPWIVLEPQPVALNKIVKIELEMNMLSADRYEKSGQLFFGTAEKISFDEARSIKFYFFRNNKKTAQKYVLFPWLNPALHTSQILRKLRVDPPGAKGDVILKDIRLFVKE